jgi:hypothetical protein
VEGFRRLGHVQPAPGDLGEVPELLQRHITKGHEILTH